MIDAGTSPERLALIAVPISESHVHNHTTSRGPYPLTEAELKLLPDPLTECVCFLMSAGVPLLRDRVQRRLSLPIELLFTVLTDPDGP